MYRVTKLPRAFLATTDEVIAQGPTNSDVDTRILLQSIQIAEERFLRPVLGSAFYDDFRAKKNTKVTAVNKAFLESLFPEGTQLSEGEIVNAIEFVDDEKYVELWNEHLWKLAAEAIVYIASPINYSRFAAAGEEQNNPKTVAFQGDGKGAAGVELAQFKFKLDKLLMERVDPLINAMRVWLLENRTDFPLYQPPIGTSSDGGVLKRTAWITGIYPNNKNSYQECQ